MQRYGDAVIILFYFKKLQAAKIKKSRHVVTTFFLKIIETNYFLINF